ncbi:MAG: glucose-1-phosphate thymidylyltransferase [Armatimonadota bacterium]|jgi:glucose-1-phosphate thymidylyltransferase
MKAVLLCAGQGTRLRPLTYCRPKHLLPVAGRAVLDRVLTALAEAGVDEAVFVVSPGETSLQEFVGDGSQWGIGAGFCAQPEPLGLAHALNCARGLVTADERFLMYLGDDLLGDGVSEFARAFAASDAAASLIVKPVDDPRAFGVVVVEDGVVTRLVEKPQNPPSDLAIVGVYGFGPQIWEAVDSIEPSARGELEITDAIDHLVATGKRVECHVTDGFWADAGSPNALLAANAFFLARAEHRIDGCVDGDSVIEGDLVTIEEGARVTRSQIIGPCLVGAGSVVEGATIGPDVAVGEGCRLVDVTLSDSIIDSGTAITEVDAALRRCVIGRNVRVSGIGAAEQRQMSLLLADDSVVGPANGE